MRSTWSISGVDLHLDLPTTRVRGALERALRDAVRSGRLVGGTRLPPSRSLAADLGLARNTVAAAYGQLVAEGWLEARQGSGTRVAAGRAVAAAVTPVATAAGAAGLDLRPGAPDLSSFPREAWLAAARRALRRAPLDAAGYPDPQGRLELRTALAGYLARARGVAVEPGRILVCSGFNSGLALLAGALRRRGVERVAVEEAGHAAHRAALAAAGLQVDPLPVDGEGAIVSALGSSGAALLTPAHQFPLGAVLAPGRRAAAVAWARASGGLVVEDDYDGEFRFDRQPVGAMQALDPEHVVYAGTASKSLAPALRLAWLVLPAALLPDVLAARQLADGPSGLEQLVLAELIESGGYDRHVRRARLLYRRRRDALVTALAARVPAARVTGTAAGLHALIELPPGRSESEVVEAAAERGLALEGVGSYRAAGTERAPALVVGYGTPPEHAFAAALERLCDVLHR